MELPFFAQGGSYVAQSPLSAQERSINVYPERNEVPGTPTRWTLYKIPGVSSIVMSVASPGKAHFFDTNTQREFAVIGNTFYEISSGGILTNRGTVAVDANPATISSNGAGGGQLFITAGANGYLFTLATNTFAAIAALAGIATMGDHLDGYFLALDSATSTVRISDLLDGATWDPTQFIQRSIAPDPWVSMKVASRYIWLLGAETSEAWFDAGSSPIPFEPHPSGLVNYGCAAPFSPEIVAGSLMWVSQTSNGRGAVIRLAGFTPEPVSNFAVETAFEALGTSISSGIGDTYDDLGHTFYFVSFVSGASTWCWDANTSLWHERGTWISEDQEYTVWRPGFHAFAFGEHRMLDLDGASVYELSSEFHTDVESREIRWLRQPSELFFENQRLFFPSIELDMEVGLGLSGTGQGSDPQVMLRYSNDGGKTWGPELWRSGGKIGQYKTRVRWLRMGAAYRRVFQFAGTDPVPTRLLNCYLPNFVNPQAKQQRSA